MKFLGIGLAAIIGVALICILIAWPTQLLWNAVVPDIFHLPVITFWQAFGLQLLASILIKSFSVKSSD